MAQACAPDKPLDRPCHGPHLRLHALIMMLRLARLENGEAEIFRSFQGEGPMAGRVRAFIRLSGCNLHCRWCDTAYTWNWHGAGFAHERDAPGAPHAFDLASEMMAISTAQAAKQLLALGAPGLVITGGEPLLQAAGVLALAQEIRARDAGLQLELETNGTKAPQAALAALLDLIVVSPKLGHSGNLREAALVPQALQAYADLPQAVFKFVAAAPSDLREIAALVQKIGIAPARVWVMPKGQSSSEVHACGAAIHASVLAAGFSYSDRLHLHLFGAARGV